jgi:SAM-dependent methyltransferase
VQWRQTRLGRVTEQVETQLVFALAGPLAGKRVLDIGTGDGTHALEAARRGGDVTGLDSDPAMLAAARRPSSRAQRPSFAHERGFSTRSPGKRAKSPSVAVESLPARRGQRLGDSIDVVEEAVAWCLRGPSRRMARFFVLRTASVPQAADRLQRAWNT